MQPQAGTARSSARPSRILIVDDHEVSRAALRALLRTEGIDVADVRTGDAAVTAAIAFRPDVVVVARSIENALTTFCDDRTW